MQPRSSENQSTNDALAISSCTLVERATWGAARMVMPIRAHDTGVTDSAPKRGPGGAGPNLVELAHQQYYAGAPATVATVARGA